MATSKRTARTTKLSLLPQTGPDTPMGQLLRRFWQPVGVSDRLAKGRAMQVRRFSEDLTLYRGDSGRAYLVGSRCAHRRTVLHTGWVQGEQIRCMYHGWRYDGTGQCTEMPAEKNPKLAGVKIAGYPVHEYAGLIFAYMGEGPAPAFDLPRKDAFERPGGLVFAREQTWNCNWFQMIENSLDAVHVSFVHMKGVVGAFGAAVTTAIPELDYLETDAGIRQIATRSKNNVRLSDWTFPNNNHIVVPNIKPEYPWFDVGVWMVPVDDEHSVRFTVNAAPSSGPEIDRIVTENAIENGNYNPADHHDELFVDDKYPNEVVFKLTSAQDYVAQMGQGAIADRENERLVTSDKGIAFLRKIFFRELDSLQAGRPTKSWKRLDHAVKMTIPLPETADA
jgi:5,5'-dehydrodivanillate O-demethylase